MIVASHTQQAYPAALGAVTLVYPTPVFLIGTYDKGPLPEPSTNIPSLSTGSSSARNRVLRCIQVVTIWMRGGIVAVNKFSQLLIVCNVIVALEYDGGAHENESQGRARFQQYEYGCS